MAIADSDFSVRREALLTNVSTRRHACPDPRGPRALFLRRDQPCLRTGRGTPMPVCLEAVPGDPGGDAGSNMPAAFHPDIARYRRRWTNGRPVGIVQGI